MDDQVVITEARIVERVEAGSEPAPVRMPFSEVLFWAAVAAAWFSLVRFVMLAGTALPWLAAADTLGAARSWLMLGVPFAVAVSAFLALQVGTRDRKIHTMLCLGVLLTAMVWHVNPGLGNPFAEQLGGVTRVTAWAVQSVAGLLGVLAARKVVRARRARRAKAPSALPEPAH